MKKSVFVSFAENFGWRNHEINEPDNIIYPYKVVNNGNSVEVKSIYPNESEAYKALNTLIGYCVGQGLKEGEYKDTDELLHQLRGPIFLSFPLKYYICDLLIRNNRTERSSGINT